MTAVAERIGEIGEAVRCSERLLPVGAGTKPAISLPAESGVTVLKMGELSGITGYDAAELTFTALAGTPLAEIEDVLGARGQYLPFDPPFRESGATLGGAIAAGVSGPGAFGSGGVRDFVIGVEVVDGSGRLIKSGGRVVKNVAGFDLSKLMVGSIGRLGVIVEVSCKVFPRPTSEATLSFELGGLAEAIAALVTLARSPLQLDALELQPPRRLLTRISGSPEAVEARVARAGEIVARPATRIDPSSAAGIWRGATDFSWAPKGSRVIAVPTTAAAVTDLEADLEPIGAPRRYALGANQALIAWPDARRLDELDDLLRSRGRGGVALTGSPLTSPILGGPFGGPFAERVRRSLDPESRFLPGVA